MVWPGPEVCGSAICWDRVFSESKGQTRIALLQLFACVNGSVVMIVLPVGIKPGLDAFGPVFEWVCRGIGAFPNFSLMAISKHSSSLS